VSDARESEEGKSILRRPEYSQRFFISGDSAGQARRGMAAARLASATVRAMRRETRRMVKLTPRQRPPKIE